MEVWLGVIIAGAVGGFVNDLIPRVEGGITLPGVSVSQDGKRRYHLGTLGNVIVGGVTAWVIWQLELLSTDPTKRYVISLIAGLMGGTALMNIVQFYQGRLKDETIDSLQDSIDNLTKTVDKLMKK